MKHILYICLLLGFIFRCQVAPDSVHLNEKTPAIYPDYTNIVLPPNIAPLNFMVRETGIYFYVKLFGSGQDTITVTSSSGKIEIPQGRWSNILKANTGKMLYIDIFSQDKRGQWQKYQTIQNKIAREPIDSHLTYRLIEPQFTYWNRLGIYQRNLEGFEEKPILINKLTGNNCMNCHSFCMNDSSKMLLHIRGGATSGTMIIDGENIKKVDTGTAFSRAGAYPSWHPSGELIAFSSNTLTLFFHAQGEIRDVVDSKSDLIIYMINDNMITSDSSIAHPEYMETFPCWSPDGNYLYFCRTNKFENYLDEAGAVLDFDNILYDLVRVKFDRAAMIWGKPEILLHANEIGLSVIMPRVSPDGKFVMFCMAKYGSFPIYRPESDIYLYHIASGNYRSLSEVNSPRCDSFHSWSHESRWFVFSSKRENGLCSRPYFSYISPDGVPSKPFLLPQKDPEFYQSFIKNYNRPELSRASMEISARRIAAAAYQKALQAQLDPKLVTGDKKKQEKEEFYHTQQ